jgi:hypothetical protein
MTDAGPFDRKLVLRWTRATWLGWLLGIPIIAALALVGEAVGVGGAQFIVGAGMGAGIGWMQGRLVRRVLPKWGPWFWASVVGLAAPFLVTDVAKVVGWNVAYVLFVCVAAGGLIVGGWQAILLRARFRKTLWWAAASALGWTLAAATSALADPLLRSRSIRGIGGALLYLGLIASGGLLLGLVTGVCLAWMVRHDRAV